MEKFERMADVDCAPPTARLVAVSGVEGNASEYLAANRRPWLSLEPISIFAPGRWFRMRYRLGLYDRPVRPLVSYRRGSEEIGWHLLPGPVLGRADWFSVVPAEATAVWISPVSEPGRFCFNVEEIEPLSSLALLRMGLAGNRGRFLSAVGAWLLGLAEGSPRKSPLVQGRRLNAAYRRSSQPSWAPLRNEGRDIRRAGPWFSQGDVDRSRAKTQFPSSCAMYIQPLPAAHTPAIVADVPGMTEFIENGVNGFHFARGNLGSLTGILRKVADEPNLASQMGAASSYERVPADMAYDLLGLYAAHGLVAPN